MTDEKISQITSTQAIDDADLFAMVHNMATTPATKGKAGSLIKTWLKTYFDTLYSGSMVIYDNTLGSAAASFDITSIPAGYHRLEVHFTWRHSSTGTDAAITVNGDAGNNYNLLKTTITSGGVTSADSFAAAAWSIGVAASGDSANYPASGFLTLHNYDGTTFNKVGQIRSYKPLNDTAANQRLFDFGIIWKSTAAINRITLTAQAGNNFVAGSRVTLVGYKNPT